MFVIYIYIIHYILILHMQYSTYYRCDVCNIVYIVCNTVYYIIVYCRVYTILYYIIYVMYNIYHII